MQPLYALSATVFFTAFAGFVVVYGQHGSRTAVIAALLLGAISQFVAQEPRIVNASNYIANAAILLSLIALGMFGLRL